MMTYDFIETLVVPLVVATAILEETSIKKTLVTNLKKNQNQAVLIHKQECSEYALLSIKYLSISGRFMSLYFYTCTEAILLLNPNHLRNTCVLILSLKWRTSLSVISRLVIMLSYFVSIYVSTLYKRMPIAWKPQSESCSIPDHAAV